MAFLPRARPVRPGGPDPSGAGGPREGPQAPVRVSFVIPVRNDPQRLRRCLDAISRNHDPRWHLDVLVADNGSTDGTPGVARAAGATVLSLPGLRVSELRNHTARQARGDVIAFVDADHEIVPTWVATALGLLGDETVGAAGAVYSAPAAGTWVQRTYGALRGRTEGRGDVEWLGSGNLAVRRAAFDAIEGFDASLEACEDVDFCQRLRAAGWRIVADERMASTHHGDPATLAALFRAERWRGRDNVRVSLRGPLTLRSAPSVVIPIVDLAALAVSVLSLLAGATVRPGWLWAAAAGVAVIVGLAALRSLRIVWSARLRHPLAWGQAFLVSLTYDLARAVALTTRAPHHRHRPSGPTASPAPLESPRPE